MAFSEKNLLRLFGTGAVSVLALGVYSMGQAISQSSNLPPITIDAPKPRAASRAAPPKRSTPARGPVRQAAAPARQQPVVPAINAADARGERGTGPVRGYAAGQSVTGTKTDTPLLLTPQAISVVTQDEITARSAFSLQEALHYTPGLTQGTYGSNSIYDVPTLRGFRIPIYADGLRLLGDVNTEINPRIYPYGAERIEVLRGSSSALYGQTPPGGLLNVLSKRPLAYDRNEAGVRFGNFDRKEGFFDFNKFVDPTVQTRIVGSGRLSGAQQDFVQDNNYYIAPSITVRPTADTTVTLLALHQNESGRGYQQYVPGSGSAFYNPNGRIPYNRYLGEPSIDFKKVTYDAIGYVLEQRFDSVFQFRQNARISRLDGASGSITPFSFAGTPLQADFRTVERAFLGVKQSTTQAAIDSQVQADFATGPVIHKVLAGVDYYGTSSASEFVLGAGATTLDVFSPQYGAPQNVTLFPFSNTVTNLKQTGVYIQDQAKLGGFVLTLTGRYDRSTTNTEDLNALTASRQKSDATTGRAGLSYVFESGVAPYISYATNFEPTIGVDRSGNAFLPRTGTTREVGIKYQPFAGALFTAAFFDTDQRNVLTTDPVVPQFQTQTGGVNVRGIELEAKVSLNRELDLIAGYAHLGPKITASNDGNVGKTLQNVAVDTASLWAFYTFRSGQLGGLGIGGGVRYVGNSFADAANAFKVPDSTIFDAAISYDFGYLRNDLKGLTARLNVTNIGNTYYVTNCFGTSNCGLGIARTVLGTLSYMWP